MLTSDKQFEIAKLGIDAAFGYTRAAINAAFETNARALRVWSEAAGAVMAKPAAATDAVEWSGATTRPHSSLLAPVEDKSRPVTPFTVWSDMMTAGSRAWFQDGPSPFSLWTWTPQSAIPATWPWAYGMISSGVPESVAWPVAEANVALFDAAKKTAEAARPQFPAYQSANGYSAQVFVGANPAFKSMLALLPTATLLWPWLERAA